MESKTKKVLYISIGVLVVGAIAYLGYKWYQKNKKGTNDVIAPKPPKTAPSGTVYAGVVDATPTQNVSTGK